MEYVGAPTAIRGPGLPPGYQLTGIEAVPIAEWAELLASTGEFGPFGESELRRQVLPTLIPGAAVFVRSGTELVACASVCALPDFHPRGVVMFVLVRPEHRGLRLG
ncbi:MAG TPA: hypothetical protein VK993_12495, partial [Chthoniobacterales bacterium]|nr:hypothetical protein [Chthoniobacterales bacterium]